MRSRHLDFLRLVFGRSRARHAQALAWLARVKRGLRASEAAAFVQWLRPKSHRTRIARLAADGYDPEILAFLCQLFPVDPSILDPPPPRRNPLVNIAAALVGCVFVAVPLLLANRYMPGLLSSTPPRPGYWVETFGTVYTTKIGGLRHILLKGGTRVALRGASRVAVEYAENLTIVFVSRGEAAFVVSSEPHVPLQIEVVGAEFAPLQGTFDVRVPAPGRADLTVLSGSVKVSWSASVGPQAGGPHVQTLGPVFVGPLEMLTIERDVQSPRSLTEQEARSRLAWQG